MRHSDPQDLRKWHIESEMLAGRNPPRIMSDYKTPEEKKLADALADSVLKTVRILELEKEVGRNICFQCGAPLPPKPMSEPKINQAKAVEAQSRIFENGLRQCVSFDGLLTGFQIGALFERIAMLEKEIAAAGTCRSCGKPVSKICPHCEHMWQT